MRFGLALVLLALTSCASEPIGHQFKQVNHVTVLGSIHGAMLRNPRYTLRDFASAIDQYKPDIILTEVRPAHEGPIEGSIDGGSEQSLVYAMGKEVGAKVVAVDWFDEEFVNNLLAEEGHMRPEEKAKADALQAKYAGMTGSGSLLQLNSPAVQKDIAAYYNYIESVGMNRSRQRNDQICVNVREALTRFSRSKVMIIFGLDHKYFLESCVLSVPGQQGELVSEWYNPQEAVKFRVPKDVKSGATEAWMGAESLLDERLHSKYYYGALKDRLQAKQGQLKIWMNAVSRLQ